jgi:hypothetical protein
MDTTPKYPNYPITWVTSYIATGRAPKSYEDLDILREYGIDAILNLCGEFSDLHELEEGAGFEVFWLPTADETAPSMPEMEKGLAWLDEAVYLGKKVLVHCHYGIGRTGTFITAYLLRRGFNLKKAGKVLKKTQSPASPSNFSQWWLLRKFGRKEGQLTLHEPDPQNRRNDELVPFFTRYELLLDALYRSRPILPKYSALNSKSCDGANFTVHLIEALYLHTKANIVLPAAQRAKLIEQAKDETNPCSLFLGEKSPLYPYRPAWCRLRETGFDPDFSSRFEKELAQLSREVFAAVFSIRTDVPPPPIELRDVISGRFIQKYFQMLALNKS